MGSTTQPTSDERILAGLAHASILLSFLGPIGPAVVWFTQRRKSQFASFHALQAMGYQILMFWFWILGGIIISILLTALLIIFTILTGGNSTNTEVLPIIFQLTLFLAIFGLWGLFLLVGLVGAVFCLVGRDFHYPLLGRWLRKYLSPDIKTEYQIIEAKEDDWVAGMSHASAILMLWGMILPLIVWVTQKDRSARLRFQSLQALLYQLAATVIYFIGMAFYFLSIFGTMFAVILGGILSPAGSGNMNNAFIVVFFVIMIIIMLFWIVLLLLVPIYHLFAFIAAVRVIRGYDYRYPILGKMLERQLAT